MNKSISVLIVDDDEDDFIILSEHLKQIPNQNFETAWANTFEAGYKMLGEKRFDICFFDYVLGIKTGLELFEVAHNLNIHTPVILLTGKTKESVDYFAIRKGVADYLEKADLDVKKLERSIRYTLERKIVLQALRDSEEKYRSIFSESFDAVCLLANDGQLTDANKAAMELLGIKSPDFPEHNFNNYFQDAELAETFLANLSIGENIPEFEAQLAAPDGLTKDCNITCTRLQLSDDDQRLYYQCIVRDVTRRKKMEQQIFTAEKLAATGRFMRMLGHEIRNPLNNIDLASNQLQEENKDKELNYYIDVIGRNSKRINKLLITLLKSTSNPGEMDLKKVSIQRILDEVIGIVTDRIELKDITLEVVYEPTRKLYVNADMDNLCIALVNILLNAIEAVKEADGRIQIRTFLVENEVGIAIQDNGHGIPKEVQNQIFEPYFSKKTNGVGLGLASTLSIIQLHQGHIELDSIENEGTTFTIWLTALPQKLSK